MKLTARGWLRSAGRVAVCAVTIWLAGVAAAHAQAVSTTTVQGTVYLANGQPAEGTLVVSWPTFTTAAGQLISAGQTTVTVGADGYLSVNLAPNQGATPAGEYYTAVFYKSDGTVSTQYWTVPAAAQASLAQVQAQVMPAAQAVQAVSKAYVDQTVAQAIGSQLSGSGGDLTGPLYLSSDPMQPMQAADKHYVDSSFSAALPLSGGTMTGPANFSAAVTFGSNVTASSGIGFTGPGAAQTLANLLPGAASDSANGMTLAGKVNATAFVNCVAGSSQTSCISAATQGVSFFPTSTTGSFTQYPVEQASAYCSVNITTGALTIFPQQLGYGYTSAPTVTWSASTSPSGGLGTIVATLGGLNNEQVVSYTVSGANSGWGPPTNYFTNQCPIRVTVAAPPAPAAPLKIIDQSKGELSIETGVNPDDFGAKGDGVTDDTMAFNFAVAYAQASGANKLVLRKGATYYLGSVIGSFAGGFDNGEVPIAATLAITESGGVLTGCSVSNAGSFLVTNNITNPGGGTGGTITATLNTGTHTISGCTATGGTGYSANFNAYAGPTCSSVPCTVLATEPVPEIGYSVGLVNSLVIEGNGATIAGGFTGAAVTASSYTTSFPYVSAFGCGQQSYTNTACNNVTIRDLNFKNTFIGIANPSSHLQLTNITSLGTGISILATNSQYDTFKSLNLGGLAGVIFGGQWMLRASSTTASFLNGTPINNEGDALVINGYDYGTTSFSTLAQWVTAEHAIDCWYDVNLFHLEDQGITNSENCYTPPGGIVRMPDQAISSLWEPDAQWRGVMGIAFAFYSRYGYACNGCRIKDVNDKFNANYPIVVSPSSFFSVDNLGAETSLCNAPSSSNAVFGSASCPNPFEPWYTNGVPGLIEVTQEGQEVTDKFTDIQGAVVVPMYDMQGWTMNSALNRVPPSTLQSNITSVGRVSPPIYPIGQKTVGDTLNSTAFQGTTQLPSDGTPFTSIGTRFTSSGGNSYKNSTWHIGSQELYVPPTMPPTFNFKYTTGQPSQAAQVLLPGLKVNGGSGVQGGQVTGFTITNAGSGYTPFSYVSCSIAASSLDIPNTSTPFQSDCAAWAGQTGTVTQVFCTHCGQGYVSAPAVTITAPTSGTTATATATIAAIDLDNPITHLTTCAFYLNSGGTISASTTTTLSSITCNGAQFNAQVQSLDAAEVLEWGQTGGFPAGLQVLAWITANNTLTVQLTNFTNTSISYPAGSSTSPWLIKLQNSGDFTWGINTVSVTPTVNSASYSPAGGGGGSSTTPDSVTCTGVAITAGAGTQQDVCDLPIPAARVPAGGIYQINATCLFQVASGQTASTFTPQLEFYNAANTTDYFIIHNFTATASVPAGSGYNVQITGYNLIAPSGGGAGYTVAGGTFSAQNASGFALLTQTPINQTVPALNYGSTGNLISIWASNSVSNATSNTATCTITGTLLH